MVLKFSKSLFIVLILTLFSSCQKVININLNSSSPKIVIEGSISDHSAVDTVKISQTINFDQTNDFPSVSGAFVKITDNVGNTDTLMETSPGIYITSTLQGVPGRTYTLNVSVSGEDYTAVSTMPSPVVIDHLTVEDAPLGKKKAVYVHFEDPSGVENYYRFVEIINGAPQKFIYLTDDLGQDGASITSSLFTRDDDYELNPGDSVVVLLQTIDKGVYDYFRSLNQITRNGGMGMRAVSPTNPISNFSNGALGYFSAYSVKPKSIVVP